MYQYVYIMLLCVVLSSNEIGLGDYLISHGESDFTHAGDIMKQVGKVHNQNAKIRLVI